VDVLLFDLFRFLVFLSIIFVSLVLRHQMMDKVHKHNSFNTNTPSSESYRSEGRGVYRVLVGRRPGGKRPLGRPKRRWEDNIKMDLREIGIDGTNWLQLAQVRVQWRAFVNTVMSLWFP
jgi:hypothetical protein